MTINLSSVFPDPCDAPSYTQLIASGPHIKFRHIPATARTPVIYYHDGPLSSQTALVTFLTIWHYPERIQAQLKARTDQIVCAFSPLSGRSAAQVATLAENELTIGMAHVSQRTIEICAASRQMTPSLLAKADAPELRISSSYQDMAHLLNMAFTEPGLTADMALLYLHAINNSVYSMVPDVVGHESGHMLQEDIMDEVFRITPNRPCPFAPADAKDIYSDMVIREIDAFLCRKFLGQFDYYHRPEEATAELIGISLNKQLCDGIETTLPGIDLRISGSGLDTVMPRSFLRINSAIQRFIAQAPSLPHMSAGISTFVR